MLRGHPNVAGGPDGIKGSCGDIGLLLSTGLDAKSAALTLTHQCGTVAQSLSLTSSVKNNSAVCAVSIHDVCRRAKRRRHGKLFNMKGGFDWNAELVTIRGDGAPMG